MLIKASPKTFGWPRGWLDLETWPGGASQRRAPLTRWLVPVRILLPRVIDITKPMEFGSGRSTVIKPRQSTPTWRPAWFLADISSGIAHVQQPGTWPDGPGATLLLILPCGDARQHSISTSGAL
ncbi:hypothetical protein GGTG_08601 [Gaeumannomyces tritici R3-111a-1]|uniref:Uncharacterized protein n=1 Tax=Gaeumannomyces tritici (strain R3-111a-1) TaxID=644352 RepID=J3P515_GAET3|nr:hypothetical protein GGTG_08601 [Gaeumannomyces tritici R3-111a-1]EJT74763.1 hypothetical protein GGTG_08601 [Gaeumannomyces tritici R3-111a-1]